MPKLKEGQVIRFTKDDPETWEVIHVTYCSATVRCMSRIRKEFETTNGDEVAFDAPGRKLNISPNSCVEVLSEPNDNGTS